MNTPLDVAKELFTVKYSNALCLFLAGSVTTDRHTSYSDLDLVVIYSKVPNAFRESYTFKSWPIEAFVHDRATLNYFIYKMDIPSGRPVLPTMIIHGFEIPGESEITKAIKNVAKTALLKGPAIWSIEEIDQSRYAITNLVDDIRDPRSRKELIASTTVLYNQLANHYLRSRGKWSASSKYIPRTLEEMDKQFAIAYNYAFDRVFKHNDTSSLITLASNILQPDGGFLFDGFRSSAPAEWRLE